jgi:transposase
LDLSRRKVDVCLLSDQGERLDQLVSPPDADALRSLARRIGETHREPVCAVIESMTGARFVHDTLEQEGWDVEIADAHKVKGLAPLACKTDKIDSRVLATLSQRDLVPAIWLPDPRVREERELARFRSRRSGCPTPGCERSASWRAFASTWSSTSRRSSAASTRP